MNIIAHRVNTIESLRQLPQRFGAEVDIRTQGSKLILQHDPFVSGDQLVDWLQEFRHGTLILNVKEDGLEGALLDLMRQHEIEDFFFLDQPFPTILKTARSGERRCAVRVSEYESADTALALAGQVGWVWADCFSRLSLKHAQASTLRAGGFSLCLVSPELQGRVDESERLRMLQYLADEGFAMDAVCTKYPLWWEQHS